MPFIRYIIIFLTLVISCLYSAPENYEEIESILEKSDSITEDFLTVCNLMFRALTIHHQNSYDTPITNCIGPECSEAVTYKPKMPKYRDFNSQDERCAYAKYYIAVNEYLFPVFGEKINTSLDSGIGETILQRVKSTFDFIRQNKIPLRKN